MLDHRLLRVLRGAVATLILIAILYQLILAIDSGVNLLNFFSFFTIQSNIIAFFVLISLALSFAPKSKTDHAKISYFRGAATLYMTITGLVYFFLLRDVDVQISNQWVNIVLHYLAPAFLLADWILNPPDKEKAVITFRKALAWLAYPLLYLVYSLFRGAITGWYPYPFINPSLNDGYIGVAITSLIITFSATGLVWVLVRSANTK